MINKKIIVVLGMLMLVGFVVADTMITNYRDTQLTEDRKIALYDISIENYTSVDTIVDRGFTRCLRSVQFNSETNETEITDILNYCNDEVFTNEIDADAWEKEKLENIADIEIGRVVDELQVIDVRRIIS